jgi:hypothetical protein
MIRETVMNASRAYRTLHQQCDRPNKHREKVFDQTKNHLDFLPIAQSITRLYAPLMSSDLNWYDESRKELQHFSSPIPSIIYAYEILIISWKLKRIQSHQYTHSLKHKFIFVSIYMCLLHFASYIFCLHILCIYCPVLILILCSTVKFKYGKSYRKVVFIFWTTRHRLVFLLSMTRAS